MYWKNDSKSPKIQIYIEKMIFILEFLLTIDWQSKNELYEASKQIHDLIIQILNTQEGNRKNLWELDSLIMSQLSNEPSEEDIQQYLDSHTKENS